MPQKSIKNTDLKALTLLFVLNLILFIPRYLFDIQNSEFFPLSAITSEPNLYKKVVHAFGWRFNYDPFRISIDYFLLCLLIIPIVKIKLKLTAWVLTSFFFLLFIYQIYFASFESIYQVKPLIFNDIYNFKLGYELISRDLGVLAFLLPIMLFAFLYLVFRIHLYSVLQLRLIKGTYLRKITIIFLVLLSSINIVRYGLDSGSENVFQAISGNLINNINRSVLAADELANFNVENFIKENEVQNFTLTKRPNIHLIAIESYGRLVYDDSLIQKDYIKAIKKFSWNLQKNSWQSASILSTSPISGGTSWVAYSSLLYGLDMKNQATYQALLSNEKMHKYPSLFNFLKINGYTSYWLSSIKPPDKFPVPWDLYSQFYGVENWIKYDDLNYNGKLVGFGPSPPDQYALNFAINKIKNLDKEPYSFFFITQNSHNPFYAPDSLYSNWQDLNTGLNESNDNINFLDVPEKSNYYRSIEYELEVVSQLITEQGTENDLFLVFGDHQPPGLVEKFSKKGAPVHIISKDSIIINEFKRLGFESGMSISDLNEKISHAGLYTTLIRSLLRTDEATPLPIQLPNGWLY